MALTVTRLDSGASGNEVGGGVDDFTTSSISPGTDCYLVFLMAAAGNVPALHDTGHTVTSSGSGPTWTKQSFANADTDYQYTGVVWTAAIGGSSPGSFTLTINWPAVPTAAYAYAIYRITGTLHTTQPGGVGTTASELGNGAVSLTLSVPPQTNDVTLAISGADVSSGGGATFGTGTWTETAEGSGANQIAWNTGYRTGSTSSTVPWSDVNAAGSESFTSGQAALVVRDSSSLDYPYFVEAGTLAPFASGTTITTTIPASATTNDIMVLGLMANGSTTFSQPSGWTLLGTSTESSANLSTEWYWKRHDGSESSPASTTSATMSGTLGGYGRVWVFRGRITTGDPFEDVTMAGDVNTTTPASATIDTTGAARLAVAFVMIDDDVLWLSGNPPSGWENIGTQATSTTGGDASFAALSKQVASASTVTGVTLGTIASEYWRTLTLAFVPPATATNATATPSVVTATVSVPAPTVATGVAVSAPVVTVTAEAVAPSVAVGNPASVFPSAALATISVLAPTTISTGVTVTPSVVTATVSVPEPDLAQPLLWPTFRSGRKVLDQNGNPWMIRGQAVWSMGTVSQADQFTVLDELAAHGHNCVMVTITETFYSNNTDHTENFYGESPFTGNFFASSLNTAFWDRWIDTVEYAETLGITIMCVIAYAGYSADGAGSFINAATTTQCQQYGNDIATLHLGHPNILYMIGGDKDFTSSSTLGVRYNAMANGLHAADPGCLIFCHTQGLIRAFTQFGTGYDLSPFDANHVYLFDGTGMAEAPTAWTEVTRPLYFIEGAYWHGEAEPDQLFRSQFWMGCSWGFGCFDGHVMLWSMDSDDVPGAPTWSDNLVSPEMDFTKICYDFYAAVDHGQTSPDFDNNLLTTGEGVGLDIAAVAYGPTFGTIYFRNSRTITCDLSVFLGSNVVCRWFDPTDGTYTAIATYATTAGRSFTHPGNNSNDAGDSDWVLVLESDGTITPASVSPSVVTATVSVPAPTVSSHAAVTATVVTKTASVPAPSVSTASHATATPAVVTATASVPAPTVTAISNAAVTATVVTATATAIAPSVSAGANVNVTPTTVTATASVLAPTATASTVAAPAAVTVAATVETATATTASSATVTPSVVTATATVLPPASIDTAGNAATSPDVTTRTASVPAPTVATGSRATPSVVSATISVPTPGVSAGSDVNVSASVVTVTTSALAPTASATSTASVTANVVTVTTSVQSPTIRYGQTVTASVVSMTADVPAAILGDIHPTVTGQLYLVDTSPQRSITDASPVRSLTT